MEGFYGNCVKNNDRCRRPFQFMWVKPSPSKNDRNGRIPKKSNDYTYITKNSIDAKELN